MNLELLTAKVGHQRFAPKKNAFSYSVYYVVTTVGHDTAKAPLLFSFDRFNILSIKRKDHGARDAAVSWRTWIEKTAAEHGVSVTTDDTVLLMSHPRLFGFAFNPISYWLVLEKNTYLKAVVCEVRNTFGDNHNYFLAHPDGRAILPTDVFYAKKNLYVSPFNTVAPGSYEFTFSITPTSFKSVINYFENGVHILNTYVGGARSPLTARAIISVVIMYPLMTFLVVYRIHYQALRLRIKGVKPTIAHMPPPTAGKTTVAEPKTTAKA